MQSRMTRVLVTGGSGILATALRPYFPHATYASHQSLDVADGGSVRRFFTQHPPFDVVIHAGAVTSNRAEGAAYCQTNIVGTAAVLAQARKQGARFVLLSSDYCLPGTGMHKESDPLLPVNTYAWSKLGAECVAQTYERSLIVRGSWYKEWRYTKAATDAFHSKLPVEEAAKFIVGLASSDATGIVHIGGARQSYFETTIQFNPKAAPCAISEVSLPYQLPYDSSLDTTRMRRLLGRPFGFGQR